MWIWQFSTSDSASTGYPRPKCVDWPPPCPTYCRRRSVPSHQMFPRNVETCRHVNGVGTKQGLSQGEMHDTRSTCPVGRVQGFTITGPCWCLVEDSDYLPDLTLKHQTACSRGMLGWMVDNGQPSHWSKAPVPASAMGSGGCAAAAYIHASLFVAQPSACLPACRNTTVWTRPETPGVASAVHTGSASGRGPRATLNATRRIRPRSRQFVMINLMAGDT